MRTKILLDTAKSLPRCSAGTCVNPNFTEGMRTSLKTKHITTATWVTTDLSVTGSLSEKKTSGVRMTKVIQSLWSSHQEAFLFRRGVLLEKEKLANAIRMSTDKKIVFQFLCSSLSSGKGLSCRWSWSRNIQRIFRGLEACRQILQWCLLFHLWKHFRLWSSTPDKEKLISRPLCRQNCPRAKCDLRQVLNLVPQET